MATTLGYFKARSIEAASGCWVWAKRRDKRGYGRMGRSDLASCMAHRAVYELINGPIPDGMTVDHECFNPPCVNPGHLVLKTHSANCKNQRSAAKTHCVNGHEYTPDNTYNKPPSNGRNGKRDCRTCIRERVRTYAMKKKGISA